MIICLVFLFILVHMSIIWFWYRMSKNPSVVDVGWASGLTLSGLIYLSQHSLSLRTAIHGSALLIWGLRLGGYLWWTRISYKKIDRRYTILSQASHIKTPLYFFINFHLQGLFIFIISISWYFIAQNPATNITLIDCLGLMIFIFSLSLESLADWQLHQFKKNHPGQVCNYKLWSLSRHPNCFFEWLIWCSFSVAAVSSPYGELSLISPLALYLIMTYLTIPVTERESIQSRGRAYIEYQLSTPRFFPKINKLTK